MKLEIVFKDGRKETLENVKRFYVTDEQSPKEDCPAFEVAQTPTEGKLFEVNPLKIDRNIFVKPQLDQKQRDVRDAIMEAFKKVDNDPRRYAVPFYTLIPKKNWEGKKSIREFKSYANNLGGWIADHHEQALEWAQRISNGESWEAVCNDTDTTKWYRIVEYPNDYFDVYRRVGGSYNAGDCRSASEIFYETYFWHNRFDCAVPLVVLRKAE